MLNNKGSEEYVLLTPYDVLREDEPAINKRDFYNSHERIRVSIDNDNLRAYVNNYIDMAVKNYEDNQRKNRRAAKEKSLQKVEKDAFKELVRDYPELCDYYIKICEMDASKIRMQCMNEFNLQVKKLLAAPQKLVALFEQNDYEYKENLSAREEAKNRLVYFKHIIENCDGYKNFYVDGKQIAKENDLQRLFRYVWYGTSYKIDAEVNNGRGQADFIISKGQTNQNIIEFKLAGNSKLAHVFNQVEVYEKANSAEGSLIAIFCFSESEYYSAKQIVITAGYKDMIDESVYLIDCRNDNKASASLV